MATDSVARPVVLRQHYTLWQRVRANMYGRLPLLLETLIALGLIPNSQSLCLQIAGGCFVLGIILFSGCLFAWVFTQQTFLVHLVPIGGIAWIIGWITLAVSVALSRGPR